MGQVDELIQQLSTASGEALHRAIRELGNRGATARDALEPLHRLARYHEDRDTRGRATLAIGLIEFSALHRADIEADVAEVEQSARKLARQLSGESALQRVALYLGTPIGVLDEDNNADPQGSRAVWIREIALQHPCVIPHLVKALTGENVLGDLLPNVLGQVGEEHPDVIGLLVPLFDHASVMVRDSAFHACAGTGRMPVEAIPRLIAALLETHGLCDTLQFALLRAAESHPIEVVSALVDTPGARGLDAFLYIDMVGGQASNVIVEELTRLLGSPDAERRRAAASGLGRMSARAVQAVPRLRPLLDDDAPLVRDAARVAIREISG